ncbi:hypothetical protein QR680_015854 [Steinernema hermaphroditum]|uniref:7TM GPCR serpentine receptor class x (Srx) domain-containing protein n=1 Tax=Steinernema hermaphroditum TaxID=289476 RepID=A0AA39H964_9BILA|nr:hypothetical protein QR680_015854 [Steinernema hermaphroditum]
MVASNGTDDPVWGSELQGRGALSAFDMMVGLSMITLGLGAVIVSVLNICAIKKLSIFHNAFGAFWVSKTVAEIGFNLVSVVVSGPVTALQPKNIPPSLGIAAYICEHYFAAVFCVMNQCVSINRLIAICLPLKYNAIFSKKITGAIIILAWLEVSALMSLYFVLPCSLIGYSPQFYEYVYVRSAECDRETSLMGTFVNRYCTIFCTNTVILDFITFYKIMKIRHTNRRAAKEETFRRNVRFFAQTALQNVSMMGSLITIVLMNNEKRSGTRVLCATFFDAKIVASVVNGLCLIFFNPEVRKLLGIRLCCAARHSGNVEPTTSSPPVMNS